MDPTIKGYITELNTEAMRLYNLVQTPIGNWLPEPTLNEARVYLHRVQVLLPTIKDWIRIYESKPENRTEIWLRQGLDLIRHGYKDANTLKDYIYSPATGFTSLKGEDFSLNYTEPEPKLPPMTLEIEELHKGRDCIHNGFFCWICDDQDWRLEQMRRETIKQSRNIFINTDLKEPFINATLEAKLQPPATWSPETFFTVDLYKTDRYYKPINKPTKGQTFGQQVKSYITKYMQPLSFSYLLYDNQCITYLGLKRYINDIEGKIAEAITESNIQND